jgi:Outer membrane protein and related peptidoglycan-associated (lipo)proteins
MKKTIILSIILCSVLNINAQLGKLIKRKAAEGAANATERSVDNGVSNIFKKKDKATNAADQSVSNAANPVTTDPSKNVTNNSSPSLKTYSKYDFIPGEKVVAYADYSQDAIGDFPNHWNTNGSAEIMTVEGKAGKWLSVGKEGYYIPLFINSLPENFTLEYDVLFIPPPALKGANTASFGFQLVAMDPKKESFDNGITRAQFQIDPYMATFDYESYTKGGEKILSSSTHVDGLERHQVHSYHVSVWRQKQRVRVYLDQNKVCDLPLVLSETEKYNSIRFKTDMNNDGSNWLMSNMKLAVGAPDTRNKLMTEGKFSTTGILFDVNSANIKAESYGTLKQIAQVLQENNAVKIKIVGHTDGDGDAAANLSLSKQRAEAVKLALTNEFGIDGSRMQTEGKGQTQPAAPNNTTEGKAQNRRVEFIKI